MKHPRAFMSICIIAVPIVIAACLLSTPTPQGDLPPDIQFDTGTLATGVYAALESDEVMFSDDDGATWSSIGSVGEDVNGLYAWDANLFAIADGAIHQYDGASWTTVYDFPATVYGVNAVECGAGLCAIGADFDGSAGTYASEIVRTTDGETWSVVETIPCLHTGWLHTDASGLTAHGSYCDDKLELGVPAGSDIYTSSDGASWSQVAQSDNEYRDLAYLDGYYVADVHNNTPGDQIYWRTNDITDWSSSSITLTLASQNFFDDDGVTLWLNDTNRLYSTTDTTNWTAEWEPLESIGQMWVSGDGYWITTYIIGGGTGGVYSSANGSSWTEQDDADYTAVAEWEGAGPTPTPTPTATNTAGPTETPRAWISEVFRAVATPGCKNWNLRGKACGWDDQFVEIGAPNGQAIPGWRIVIEDGASNEVCNYTIRADNFIFPLKAFWQDTMTTVGTPTPPATCGQWPSNGVAVLYDADGNEVDRRPYVNATPNASWANPIWPTPVATWEYQTPSPGTAW